MKKRLTLALCCILLSFSATFAQHLPYVSHWETGILIGQADGTDRANFSIQSLHGFRINNIHDFGILVGFDRYPGAMIMPFGVGWRGTLRPENRVSLFAGMDVGYGSMVLEKKMVSEWNQHSWFEGGLMVQPSVGMQFRKRKSSTMTFSLGYKQQQTNYFEGNPINDPWLEYPSPSNPDHWQNFRKDEIFFRSMSVKLGYIFL
jgi:hypothetical protein